MGDCLHLSALLLSSLPCSQLRCPTEPTKRSVSAARSQELWYKSKLQRVQQAVSSRVGALKETQAELKAAVQQALEKAEQELAVKLTALDAQHRESARRGQAERAAAVENVRSEAATVADRTAAEHEATIVRLRAEHEATIERLLADQVCIRCTGDSGALSLSSRPSWFLRRLTMPSWKPTRFFDPRTLPR